MDENVHQETLEFLRNYTDTVEEIPLFYNSGHNDKADALDQLRRELPKLKRGMQDFRDAGFKTVSVNVLVTFGHIDEVSGGDSLPIQKIVGYRRDVSHVYCCPNNEEFLRFTEEKYRLYAQAEPNFIWVDDDIKIFWNGVKFGCFCPEYLRKFNEKYGFSFDRETLVNELDIADNTALREKWVQDVCERITNLLARIKKAIREVKPDMPLGFMTQRSSWSTYNGMDFPAWFTALDAVKGRPGKTLLFVRQGETATGLCVMQMMLDTGEDMEAAARGANKVFWLKGEKREELPAQKRGEWTVFMLPTLEPYTPVFLLAE